MSNYPKDSKYYNDANLKCMHTFIREDSRESKKAKSINKTFVDDELKLRLQKLFVQQIIHETWNEQNSSYRVHLHLLTIRKNVYTRR